MKTAKLIELERNRIALMDEARELLRQMDGETDSKTIRELERKHDAAMRSLDLNKLDQDEERMRADDEAARESRRPGGSGAQSGSDDNGANWLLGQRSDWQDQRGNPVRVLTREDRWSERDGKMGVGDLIRAKITGARNDEEKRALSEGTDSAGGYTVPTPLAERFIDRMRAKSVAIRAGAMTVPMESETLAIARVLTDPSVGWRAENAALAEGDPTFDRVTFTAKTLAGGLKLSRELAEDSINIGTIIENSFAQAMAKQLDYAAIYGDGLSNAPTGVANTSGINAIAMEATDGAPLPGHCIEILARFLCSLWSTFPLFQYSLEATIITGCSCSTRYCWWDWHSCHD